MTRGSDKRNTSTTCHTLNFFCDDEDGCAFTTLVRGFRFHIIAEAKELRSKSKSGPSYDVETRYLKMVRNARNARKIEEDPQAAKPSQDSGKTETVEPEQSRSDSQDSGLDQGHRADSADPDTDSAVDVGDGDGDYKPDDAVERLDFASTNCDKLEQQLQNWMVEPFADIFQDLPILDELEEQSLEEWYTGPTYFYTLHNKDGIVQPVEVESQEDLEDRIRAMVPQLTMPKYIRDLDIPWVNAKDAIVISESSEPDPYHPSRVRVDNEVHFLKLVDGTQPQPTKREINIMKEIEKKSLHKRIRVPTVTGLVGFADSKTEIMGFLMTNIEDPTPLTKMLDTDVVEDNREKWARESQRMVEVLHQNNIIWGDAKADNFMVDKHGDLWIIDFGGSYTDGWVDPELMETREGDDMGIDRIVGALRDPEANTFDPEANETEVPEPKSTSEANKSPSNKRTRDEGESEDDVVPSKRKKSL